ncbi:MAG: hypothetical protein KDA89_23750 [Planctomycetaceae bacterium]|nr:hypothetical protein [Planctomycetaceae bacterium]
MDDSHSFPVRRFCLIPMLMFGGLLAGCGQGGSADSADASADDVLMDELFREAEQNGQSADKTGAVPVAKSAPGQRLELRLQSGDRFPLVKTIQQSLVQKPEQFAAAAQTMLELHMVILVEDTRPDAILMNVTYKRVVYEHDVNGHRMEFDSDQHQNAVPEEILPYAGMVNNGFSFWLGRDNTIREVVDYPQFLERCVAQVPVEKRQYLLQDISSRFGDDGVANFIDDAIGLLPFDSTVDPESATTVAPGDVWTRERRMMLPVPVYMTSTCRLVSLNESTAEIDITGRIAPGETYHDVRGDQSARIRIRGGQSFGSCTVDRATGLPLELKRTRYLQMSVATAEGASVEQDKRVITTIRAFPERRGPVVGTPPSRDDMSAAGRNSPSAGIRPVAGENTGNRQQASQIPTQIPPLSSTTRAVYPDE